MIFAQIKNNLIVNTIIVDDCDLLPVLTQDFDACVQIDNIIPQPAIGWSYDGTNFMNQVIMPDLPSLGEAPTGSGTTFPAFTLSSVSGGYTVSINGDTVSIGCQDYDYKSLRYVLYVLLTQSVFSIGPFTMSDAGITQNNQFVIAPTDSNLIYQALCTLV